jgi:deoxycytidine triphosphate deaminase
MRSSFARDWLDHSAADSIWPGFQGQITFELRNDGPRPYVLRSGMRPLQLAFTRMAAVPARPYNGLYQNQEAQLHSRMPKENA